MGFWLWPTAPTASPSAPAPPSLLVANIGEAISPGVSLTCYGPYHIPTGAKSIRSLMPEVNLEIVHHMIMFGGRTTLSSALRGPAQSGSSACNMGKIMYAWARTGQKTPLGLNFSDVKSKDVAFAVGTGTQYEWVALQIHYQQMNTVPVRDVSGVRLSFASTGPEHKLDVTLMASYRLRIPPHVKMDECVACRVKRGGTVVAWRNHAHRLARDVYSEHFASDGRQLPDLGLISAQQAQIFRILEEPRTLNAGMSSCFHSANECILFLTKRCRPISLR